MATITACTLGFVSVVESKSPPVNFYCNPLDGVWFGNFQGLGSIGYIRAAGSKGAPRCILPVSFSGSLVMEGMIPLVLTMLATGVVAGLIAGLLGVGGGIVIVPVLDTALAIRGVDPAIRMHVAVGTSLATIIFTSISSARAHHVQGAVDMDLVKLWGPFIFVGSLMGSVAAAQVESIVLAAIFGVVALLIAIQMLLPLDNYRPWKQVPKGAGSIIAPTFIGGLSSMMGIGGGTFSVATLTMMSQPIHRAVGTAAVFGLFIAVPGTIGFIINGLGDPRLPAANLGYVNLIGVLLIAPMTMLTAPIGARAAHKLSKRHLSLAFGFFLLLVSARMLARVFGLIG